MKIAIKPISKKALKNYLKVEDLTVDQSKHAVGLLYREIKAYIAEAHQQSELRVYRPDPVVTVADNYDRLLFAEDNLGRSSTYTHYLDRKRVLRTHTSAGIPGTLDQLAKEKDWQDIVIVLPGLVYRRDVTDKTHLGVSHQLDMWRVVKNDAREPVVKSDLLKVVKGLAKLVNPIWQLRIIDSPHPYTEQGIEVNLVKGEQDIEILECGLINRQILQNAGLDPKQYSGWAMGMGLDRLVMIRKGITDIRYLRSDNPKMAAQMSDLKPYREVSNQPSISRDMSYSVPKTYVEEDINEEIRQALGKQVSILESVVVKSETDYKELPKVARQRLGAKKGQKNVLVRITLRHLSKTLTDQEANKIYSQVYKKVNYGEGGYEHG